MLSDFLLLERYYDAPDTALVYEDLTKKYGGAAVQKAIAAGYIMSGRFSCGARRPRRFLWMTDKGREKAAGEGRAENNDHAVPA